MEKPIIDPPVPYIGPIYGGRFGPGKLVRIQGTAPGVAYRFDINLQCGSENTPRDDIALQVSVRILDGFIVINSLQNGIWGEEQRGLSSPIKRAERFEIIILCDFSQYKIAINGQHYCAFPQRIHYDCITHLAIEGDVSIIQISYESSSDGVRPASSTGTKPMPFPLAENEDNEFVMLDPNKAVAVHGAPPAVGFAQPPPYGAPMLDNQRAPSPYNVNAMGAPYPAGPAPYPTSDPGPYPAPYPTGVPGTVGMSHYPPPGAPGIPPPPLGAPVPLNAASSNFRAGKLKYEKWQCLCFIITAVVIIAALVVGFSAIFTKRKVPKS